MTRIIRVVGIFLVISLVSLVSVIGSVFISYRYMPVVSRLPREIPQPGAGISQVYAADGSLIGEFRGAEAKTLVPADKISNNVKVAAVASEDHNFYSHEGLDWSGITRAFWKDVTHGSLDQGGSTISQQLAKNVYTGNERTLSRKAKEAFIASKLEKSFTKDEILSQYLNTVYMGDSNYGVEAAAQSYFHKSAADLTLSEGALLVEILPAPSEFSPRSHPEIAETRRLEVLDKIQKYKMAPQEEIDKARAEKPVIFPPADTAGRYPFFMDYVRRYLLETKGIDPEVLYKGGLRIETTLDPAMQDQAKASVAKTLTNPNDPEASLVSVEPTTGYVRALVGGRDWSQSKVNLALGKLGGGSGRQAGSSFKPFVLARAYAVGVKPSTKYPAPSVIKPRGFDKPVGNYEGGTFGVMDLNQAMAKSANTVFVQLIADVGPQQTGEMAKALGINSLDTSKPIYGSLAIGAYEVSPLDMASAYGVFANHGVRAEPTPILKITDPKGQVIEDNTVPVSHKVIEPNVADNVTKTLTGVVDHGTGTRAKLGRPVAGKTGTSDNYENAWFVGYTPQLATAVWMGYPQANKSLYGIHGVGRVTGGSLPAQMWHDYMIEAVKTMPIQGFPEPPPIG